MNATLQSDVFNCNFAALMKSKGYDYFINGDYNLNIIGVRSSGSAKQTNYFDDALVVDYKVKGQWNRFIAPFTTDPGHKSLVKPVSSVGCAILVPGQYKGMFKLGYHQGKYRAFVQNKPVKVYRDNNKDLVLDMNSSTIEEGVFGINLHHAGGDSTFVENWSAGCQVTKRIPDFNKVLALGEIAAKLYGNSFTYTLLEQKDLLNFIK